MHFDRIVSYFMPPAMRNNALHPQYHEFRIVVSVCLIGLPLVFMFPAVLYYFDKPAAAFLINNLLVLITLLSVKYFGHYRVPMALTALVTYFIVYGFIKNTGQIYSPNLSILHIYLLAAVWADKRYGWWSIFTNLGWFIYIYYQTPHTAPYTPMHQTLGSPLYALLMNCLITIFFGGFLAYLQLDQERDQLKIKTLQDHKITTLDEVVKKRTEQLNSMRETIATDFHDQTGNMLSAITRQASMLRIKLGDAHNAGPMVDSIIKNSNNLYASSKDFLWHLNHDSDNPQELFDYLTGYGQMFYNQFDISFSSIPGPCRQVKLVPYAALNVIYIFKEAMTNVIKHSGAGEVHFLMHCNAEFIIYQLQDDGHWKAPEPGQPHYGLENMERRCKKNGFGFRLLTNEPGTSIEISVPFEDANQQPA
jgi:signal transduction histidine kinase